MADKLITADVEPIAEAVAQIVSCAPPFTTEQAERIAAAFAGLSSRAQVFRKAA